MRAASALQIGFRRLVAVLGFLAVLVGLVGCVGATDPATDVRSVSATLNAHGHTDNGPAYWWWEYGTSQTAVQQGLGTRTPVRGAAETPDSTDVSLHESLGGLTPGTSYYFRACGRDQNSTKDVCGQIRSFTTLPGPRTPFAPFLRAWGSRGAAPGQFGYPTGVALDSAGNVYVADPADKRVQKFSSTGALLKSWGPDIGAGGQFVTPAAVATDPSGNVYVTDTSASTDRVDKFKSDGTFLRSWGGYGSADGQFKVPSGIATDSAGNVYVAENGNNRVQKFTSDGIFITKWGTPGGQGDGEFNLPTHIAVDRAGNVYVTDTSNHRVEKFTSTGSFITKWGVRGEGAGQFAFPGGIATDSSGNVYVADLDNNRIEKFAPDGRYITSWGGYGTGTGQLYTPEDLAIDAAGNTYVADANNYRIQVFGPTQGDLSSLAAAFKPVLRFDNSEQQRPLNVDMFLAEGIHRICDGSSCSMIRRAADLQQHNTFSSYIDIAGRFAGGSALEYQSPNSACVTQDVWDCDTGPASSLYYRISGPYPSPSTGTGYTFIDYWMFYRVNDYDSNIDQHEGDWEAVTVAPTPGSLNPATFDFEGLSQHGHYAFYLRQNLACQSSPSTDPPPLASCGPQSKRLAVMVSNGGHANYAKSCVEDHTSLSCSSSFSTGGFERGYDGSHEWGNAFAPAALLPLPPDAGGFNWANWLGTWGKASDGDCHPGPSSSCPSPAGPLRQSVGLECASIDNDPGCSYNGPRAAAAGHGRRPRYRSPGLAAASCKNWFGPSVTAAVCNPKVLRAAVLSGRVGRSGVNELGVPGGSHHTAAGRGITQLMGAPVRLHQRVTIGEPVAKGTYLFLHIEDRRHHKLFGARYHLRPTKSRGKVHAARLSAVTFTLTLRTEHGRVTPLLSGRAPSALKTSKLRHSHK